VHHPFDHELAHEAGHRRAIGHVPAVERDGNLAVGARIHSILGSHEAMHVVAAGDELPREPGADEARDPGHQDAHYRLPRRSRSALTIISTRPSKLTRGAHPSAAFAFDASPTSTSTSAGRRNAGSSRT